jgi:hypothetical protein
MLVVVAVRKKRNRYKSSYTSSTQKNHAAPDVVKQSNLKERYSTTVCLFMSARTNPVAPTSLQLAIVYIDRHGMLVRFDRSNTKHGMRAIHILAVLLLLAAGAAAGAVKKACHGGDEAALLA